MHLTDMARGKRNDARGTSPPIDLHNERLSRCGIAVVLLFAPFLLNLGQSGPVALWLSVVTGVAALLLPILTDHPTGIIRVIPYSTHLWVDRAVGIIFLIAPFAFGFSGVDAWYYWVLAVAVLLTTSVLNAPDSSTAHDRLGVRAAR